jgi:hypothetical protein
MVPPAVLAECRARAQAELAGQRPTSRAALAAIVGVWIAGAAVVVWLLARAVLS